MVQYFESVCGSICDPGTCTNHFSHSFRPVIHCWWYSNFVLFIAIILSFSHHKSWSFFSCLSPICIQFYSYKIQNFSFLSSFHLPLLQRNAFEIFLPAKCVMDWLTSISGHEAVIKNYSILFLDLALDAHQGIKFSPLLSKLKPFFPLLLPSNQHKGNTCCLICSLIFPEWYVVYKIYKSYFNMYIINRC